MAFTEINKPAIGVPTKKTIVDAIIDNISDLNSRSSPAARNNMISNGSFELDSNADGDPDSWAITLYTGGSRSISTTNNVNGAKSLSFTSTNTANGGGYATSEDFIEVTGSQDYYWFVFSAASASNVSSKAELIWYDEDKSTISTSSLYQDTSTTTSMTSKEGFVSAPSTARYAKFRVTGGVPGVGSSTGTLYFDDVKLFQHIKIRQSWVTEASIGQAELKKTTATTNIGTTETVIIRTGGIHSLGYHGTFASGNATGSAGIVPMGTLNNAGSAYTDIAADSNVYKNENFWGREVFVTWPNVVYVKNSNTDVFRARETYINSSPPYDFGDGVIMGYLVVRVDNSGRVHLSHLANDPPWVYNGPTDCTPDAYHPQTRKPLKKRIVSAGMTLDYAISQGEAAVDQYWASIGKDDKITFVELTDQIRNADWNIYPTPFLENKNGFVDILIDPMSDIVGSMITMMSAGDNPLSLIDRGYIKIQNTKISRAGPPAIDCVSAKWKNTLAR